MDALEGVRIKLHRARYGIEEIHDGIVAYIAEENYAVVGEFNRETSEYVIRGEVTKPTFDLGVIAGEIVHNLRSALDHLAWRLALLTTSDPHDRTQFPIAFTQGEFRDSKRMIRDIAPQHQARIESFQPYNGTDEAWTPLALRDLRVLSNTDKHRLINATVARSVRQLAVMREKELVIVRDALATAT